MALSSEQRAKWEHRIAVMLAMSTDAGATPDERTAALDKATSLMTKYGITEAEAIRADGDVTSLEIGRVYINKYRNSRFEFKLHRDNIANAVCKLLPVKMMYVGKTRLMFIGTKMNLDFAVALYNRIDDELEMRAKADATLASLDGVFADTNPTTWYSEYKTEAANIILSRANLLRHEREQHGISNDTSWVNAESPIGESDAVNSDQVQALMVMHTEAISTYIEEQWGNKIGTYRPSSNMSTYSHDARSKGRIAGNSIKLTQDIEGGA